LQKVTFVDILVQKCLKTLFYLRIVATLVVTIDLTHEYFLCEIAFDILLTFEYRNSFSAVR